MVAVVGGLAAVGIGKVGLMVGFGLVVGWRLESGSRCPSLRRRRRRGERRLLAGKRPPSPLLRAVDAVLRDLAPVRYLLGRFLVQV